jgi:hypothetical protein
VPPPQALSSARSAWGYGSAHGGHGAHGPAYFGNDVVGPRFSSGMRKLSGASSVGSAGRAQGDDVSSTAVSQFLHPDPICMESIESNRTALL